MSMQTENDISSQTAELVRLMAAGMRRESQTQSPGRIDAAPDVAALFDLSQRILHTSSPKTLFRVLAEGVKELSNCATVVVARRHGQGCRVVAVSGIDSFDPCAGKILEYQSQCTASLTGEDAGDERVHILKLFDSGEQPTFVCLIIGLSEDAPTRPNPWATKIAEAVGPAVHVKLATLESSRIRRAALSVAGAWRIDRRTGCFAAAALIAISLVPWPYRVLCDCVVEPIVRRHVAAPFDGTLSESLCKPGDYVKPGQVLGRLDAKELRWELAAVTADRDRAAKSRDINQSAGKTAAAQIDRLEAQRLDERCKLLEHRLTHLDIKSPIAGVVLTGDLERAQGAPVKSGQSLYEVAPLDRMVLEVFVPEREIDRVRVDQPLSVTLESQWLSTLDGRLERIFPRAEVREDANVFVSESTVDNQDGKLRPGMKGRAAVRTDRQPLIWIAGHRVVEQLYRWLQ